MRNNILSVAKAINILSWIYINMNVNYSVHNLTTVVVRLIDPPPPAEHTVSLRDVQ